MKKSLRTILTPDFFDRDVLRVAPDLLGKYLVAKLADGTEEALMITEVEAYDGPHDLACHASKGRTKRTEPLFGPPGAWYVYLIYGMYDLLNIVTGSIGYPAAVLIRGAGEHDGPGKLTRAIGVTRVLSGEPARKKTGLWIEDRGEIVRRDDIVRTPRIGVAYAGEWALKPYRFLLKERGV